MADPLRRDIVARRNTPFAAVWTFEDDAGDPISFVGATLTMQVRQYGAQGGTALVDLEEVVGDLTEGLVASSGQVAAYIDETTLLFLPTGATGADVVFEYDLKVDLADRVAEVWQYGTFTVTPGVTDRIGLLITEADEYLLAESGDYLLTE